MHSLVVIAGSAAGARIDVPDEGLVLGRDRLTGGDGAMSREHASLTPLANGGLLLQDLGSTNGTFVNGDRLARPYVLRPGDVIRVGSTELELVGPADGTGAPPAPPGGVTAAAGGAAVGGSVVADRGSIGAIGTVQGDVDIRHSYDVSGMEWFTRTRGLPRFLIILGTFVSIAGFVFFAYPIVRELAEGFDSGSSVSDLNQAIRDCEDRFPAFSDERFECIRDAQGSQFAKDTDDFGPDLTPWLPIGGVLFIVGMVITLAGMFMVRRED